MRPTPRFWHTVALAGVLAGLGVLAERPAGVLGGAALGAWLLTSQYTALTEFRAVDEQLDVTVEPVREAVVVDEPVSVTASISLASPTRSRIEATVRTPPGAELDDDAETTVVLEPGETSATTTFTCSFPVAGEFDYPPVSVTIRSHNGMVTETLTADTDQRLRVDPQRPRNLHIGQGGDRVDAYGEHAAGSGPSGLVPEEIRQYVTGDTLDQIDWKATARLRSPHVREFETETDRKTIIAVDHSERMNHGPEGRTMLDYAREVGLGHARAAESFNDPLGFYAIDDEGITVRQRPTTAPLGYRHIRNALHDLEPTAVEEHSTADRGRDRLARPADARSTARRLAGDDSTFSKAVSPFLADTDAYVQRIESDPLFEGIRRILAETDGQIWLVLLTTDARRDRIRDAASLVTSEGGTLSLFLTPQVLFDADSMDDLSVAYDRYASFESFRRSVDRGPRTEVYEMGPGDRLDAILAARRRARQ